MKPRRLHKLTIFSMRGASCSSLIGKYPQISQIYADLSGETLSGVRFNLWNLWINSALRFDRDFGLYRIRNEALLVRHMIHLLDLVRSRLFLAGEIGRASCRERVWHWE